MSDLICPLFRNQAVSIAVTIACQVDGVKRAPHVQASMQQMGAAAIAPDPDPASVRDFLNAGWLLEAQRCIGEQCAVWNHGAQRCGLRYSQGS